ncbi:MAG: hypothetical protein KGL39_17540 [Patescibacteria group bacterium]|nr:hypothetical protein [Patescibacteria group bacterium]
MALLDDVADYLQQQAIGTRGTDLFVARMPDEPDAAVVLIDTGGGEPSLVDNIDTPSWQVRVRAGTYPDAAAKAYAINNLLHGVAEMDLGAVGATSRFHLIWAIQSPVSLGQDEKQRHEFSQNFRAFWGNPGRT